MATLEEKKIIIRLPRLEWRSLLNIRFGIGVLLLLTVAGVGYWYQAVRPYFWIQGAHVEAFSAVLNSEAGRIMEMGPKEGDRIKKGQMLAVLDHDFIFTKYAQARRTLEVLQTQMEGEKGKMSRALEDYIAAANELEVGIGSEDKVARQLTHMEEVQEKSNALAAQLASAQTTFADLDGQIKKMTLTAPFDGIVLKQASQSGAVTSYGDPIYYLCDPQQLWIEGEIPEQAIRRVAIGTSARVRLPAYPGQEWAGTVTYIGPATVAKSSLLPLAGQKETIPIRITLESPTPSLKPGLSAQVGLKIY